MLIFAGGSAMKIGKYILFLMLKSFIMRQKEEAQEA
jgi:hypothetical protein